MSRLFGPVERGLLWSGCLHRCGSGLQEKKTPRM